MKHGKRRNIILAFFPILLGCAPDLAQLSNTSSDTDTTSSTLTALEEQQNTADSAGSVRIILHQNYFYNKAYPNIQNCAGDANTYFYGLTADDDGDPQSFEESLLDSTTTIKPSFIRNVSVDLTDANLNTPSNNSYACSYGDTAPRGPTACASFDDQTDDTETDYLFESYFYTAAHHLCSGEGPISSFDPAVTKLLSGGVYIDINRDQLGPYENLLMHLKYYPLKEDMCRDAVAGCANTVSLQGDSLFEIHLAATGISESALKGIFQPRYLAFADEEDYPKLLRKVAVLTVDPSRTPSHIHEEQVLIPLAADTSADQIRIEKYQGSAILMEVSLYRMGYR